MQTNLSIKTWAEDDRPREKMLLKGKTALSDAELIAILLGSGTQSKSAVELAKEILHECKNDLQLFGRMNKNEFMKFKGIGEAKAITLLAALELGRRRKDTESTQRKTITSAKMAYELLEPLMMDLDHEEFYVIYLSRSNKLLGIKQVSVGGMTGTIADGKVIFKEALDLKATGMILAHNHPSGRLKPSEQDLRLTSQLRKFGTMIEIGIIDHIIVTDAGFFSFAENGLF